MKQITTFTSLFALLLVLFASGLSAQADLTISIQGTLKDASGLSVSDGQRELTFRLYDNINAPLADAVWIETAQVTVSGGIYSHNLGSEEELVAGDFRSTLFLGVTVEGIELSPRTQMTYAPYALAVNSAQQIARQGCSGQVGDVKYSILNPTQFADENGECWVPMDGRAIPGTRLAGIIGANVPDMSGLFIRATEFAGGADNDPDRGPMEAAFMQNDGNKQHNHTFSGNTNNDGSHSHIYKDHYTYETNFPYNSSSNTNGQSAFTTSYPSSQRPDSGDDGNGIRGHRITDTSSSTHQHAFSGSTNSAGTSQETRPKNMNFFIYIRVD